MKWLDSYRRLRQIAQDLRIEVAWYEGNTIVEDRIRNHITSMPLPCRHRLSRPDFRRIT